MKRSLCVPCFIMLVGCLGPSVLSANSYLSWGIGSLTEFDDEYISLYAQTELEFSTDLFFPLTESFSIFTYLGTDFYYIPVFNYYQYLYVASVDFSFRSGNLLIKPSFEMYCEFLYDEIISLPDFWSYVVTVLLSYDFEYLTVSLTPTLTWEMTDIEMRFFKTRAVITFGVGEANIISFTVESGISILDSPAQEFFVTPELEFSWYATIPLVLSTTLSYTFYSSDCREILVETKPSVQTREFNSLYWDVDIYIFLEVGITIEVYLPVLLKFKNHHAVLEETYTSEQEFLVVFSPQIFFRFDLNQNNNYWILGFTSEQYYSNTPSERYGSYYFSFALEWNF